MYAHLVGVRVLLDELEGVELGVGSALSVSVGVADGDEADEGDCRGSKGRLRAVTGADMVVAVREQDALSRSRSRVCSLEAQSPSARASLLPTIIIPPR